MTPEGWAAFLQIYTGLPRAGPGLPADVHWALDHVDLTDAAAVLDAGCGPGSDTRTLADALPAARISACDTTADFVTQAAARTARFGPRVSVQTRDMAAPGGTYDLIWCAGALYFLGVTAGLRGWRSALAPGGHVAFSHPVLLNSPPAAPVAAFWAEYPEITDLDGVQAQVAAAGYTTVAARLIVGAAWQAYYDPMQARIDALRGEPASAALVTVMDACQQEIDRWHAARDEIAYVLLVVAPQ